MQYHTRTPWYSEFTIFINLNYKQVCIAAVAGILMLYPTVILITLTAARLRPFGVNLQYAGIVEVNGERFDVRIIQDMWTTSVFSVQIPSPHDMLLPTEMSDSSLDWIGKARAVSSKYRESVWNVAPTIYPVTESQYLVDIGNQTTSIGELSILKTKIPIRPRWPQLALASLVSGVFVAATYSTLMTYVRIRRLLRNVCGQCGYKHVSEQVCSECGAVIARKFKSAT